MTLRFDRWVDVLFIVEENNGKHVLSMHKKNDMAYCHMFKIIKEFEVLGLVTTVKKSRSRFVTLTDKGNEIIANLRNVKLLLGI